MITKTTGARWAKAFVLLVLACALSACDSAPKLSEGFGNMGDKALEVIGFKKPERPPEIPEAAKPARKMKLRISASESLNVDPKGNSLSLLVRVYKLRTPTAFLNAPYEIFGNSNKEKEVLADELIESREIVLLPGQDNQLNERWAREATHLGVVALFRAPAEQRWRYAFELESFQQGDGIVLGAHACSLSVASGTPVGPGWALRKNPSECSIRQTVPADSTNQTQVSEGK